MKYYIIAGEASGDLHSSNLMREIRKLDSAAVFRCWGGDKMKDAGAELVRHFKDIAYMGFVEVAKNLRTILKNIEFCKKDLLSWQPDALILVDYPGFNLRIAEFAKHHKIKTYYYISPQIWAWKTSRVHKIIANTDKVITILPFEKDFYARYGYAVEYAGHPLLDAINCYAFQTRSEFLEKNKLPDKKIIALLPGSREQEISKILPVMLETAKNFPQYFFVIAGLSSVPEHLYPKPDCNITVVYNQTYDLLNNAAAAVVASGTATLETALLNVPLLVCYKANPVSFSIARRIVKVKYISLVNLIADKEVVKELIQKDCNAASLSAELQKLLTDDNYRNTMLDSFNALRSLLGECGASQRAASFIYKHLTENA